jgi:hypothetical protein
MGSIWAESIHRSFDQALELLAAAVGDCTDELWEASMWQAPAPALDQAVLGAAGEPVSDPVQRLALAQRHATPWGVAWHALEVLDYDLNGEFGPWAPPPPFTGHAHWRDLTRLPVAWSRSQVLGYIDYCRERVRTTLASMTDDRAAAPLPPAHRYAGRPHAWAITALVGHTTEHASQIRQFITMAR